MNRKQLLFYYSLNVSKPLTTMVACQAAPTITRVPRGMKKLHTTAYSTAHVSCTAFAAQYA